jgi:hypothetical protein
VPQVRNPNRANALVAMEFPHQPLLGWRDQTLHEQGHWAPRVADSATSRVAGNSGGDLDSEARASASNFLEKVRTLSGLPRVENG